ncbi:MAG TPA: hypothetical protein VNQ73_10845 [Ilumatobacter sp.]|nr:hypothetical protein [Ilumatobacter sp.]
MATAIGDGPFGTGSWTVAPGGVDRPLGSPLRLGIKERAEPSRNGVATPIGTSRARGSDQRGHAGR